MNISGIRKNNCITDFKLKCDPFKFCSNMKEKYDNKFVVVSYFAGFYSPFCFLRFTYEVAPVFTLIEEIVLQKMLGCIGWSDGEGIFAPGK
jgi:hypothetical protein